MRSLHLRPRAEGPHPLVVAALGAHCDDVEIGAGGLLLRLAEAFPGLLLQVTVLTSTPVRAAESRAALRAFTPGAQLDVEIGDLPDGRLPAHWGEVKSQVEAAADRARSAGGADLVLCPWRGDRHQDHRLLAELVPTAFRDHLVLGYEIVKREGDLGHPAVHVPLDDEQAERKFALLHEHYPSQRTRTWFDRDTLLGQLRLRGVSCGARWAEAFHTDTVQLGLPARPTDHLENPCAS